MGKDHAGYRGVGDTKRFRRTYVCGKCGREYDSEAARARHKELIHNRGFRAGMRRGAGRGVSAVGRRVHVRRKTSKATRSFWRRITA